MQENDPEVLHARAVLETMFEECSDDTRPIAQQAALAHFRTMLFEADSRMTPTHWELVPAAWNDAHDIEVLVNVMTTRRFVDADAVKNAVDALVQSLDDEEVAS